MRSNIHLGLIAFDFASTALFASAYPHAPPDVRLAEGHFADYEDPNQLYHAQPIPGTGAKDIQSSVTTSIEDYEQATSEDPNQLYHTQPIPETGAKDIQSSVTTSNEDYEQAGASQASALEPRVFGEEPFPLSDGVTPSMDEVAAENDPVYTLTTWRWEQIKNPATSEEDRKRYEWLVMNYGFPYPGDYVGDDEGLAKAFAAAETLEADAEKARLAEAAKGYGWNVGALERAKGLKGDARLKVLQGAKRSTEHIPAVARDVSDAKDEGEDAGNGQVDEQLKEFIPVVFKNVVDIPVPIDLKNQDGENVFIPVPTNLEHQDDDKNTEHDDDESMTAMPSLVEALRLLGNVKHELWKIRFGSKEVSKDTMHDSTENLNAQRRWLDEPSWGVAWDGTELNAILDKEKASKGKDHAV